MSKVEIEWIPTKERLPETRDNYLVTFDDRFVTVMYFFKPNDNCKECSWESNYYSYRPLAVAAWAYLPEPYKED